MKLTKTTINKIAALILNQPLKNPENLGYFFDVIHCTFNEINESVLIDMLTDVSCKKNEILLERLVTTKDHINNCIIKYGDAEIHPTRRSINLAYSDFINLEKELVNYLDGKFSEKEKGESFEKIVLNLFKNIGFKLDSTKSSGDFGIDLIGRLTIDSIFDIKLTLFIQCKYHENKMDVNVVKKVMSDVLFNQLSLNEMPHPVIPIIVSKSQFTKEAESLAKKYGVVLFDFSKLIRISIEHREISINELV